MHSRFLVLGMASGGLFMARQLRRMSPNCEIYAIGDTQHDIGRYSKVINRFYNVKSMDRLTAVIRQAYDDNGRGSMKAFMCSNPILEAIVLGQNDVFEYLSFDNPLETYKTLVDKTEVEKLCQSLNISRPLTYSFTDDRLKEIEFPVVVKPLEKALAIGASKCAFIQDKTMMKAYLERIKALGISLENLICQQYIEGDNRWEYGYGGYFRNGNPLVDICFYQFRQSPQGLCCYVREIVNDDLQESIKALVRPILKLTGYSGMIEFDVKQDENTRRLYLLDINPRPWRSSDMLMAKLGNYSTVFSPIILNNRIVWRYPYRELYANKNHNNVPYSVCKAITNGAHTVTQKMLYDKHDVNPLRMQRIEDFFDFIKKLK